MHAVVLPMLCLKFLFVLVVFAFSQVEYLFLAKNL